MKTTMTTRRFLAAACVALALPITAMAFPEGRGGRGGCDAAGHGWQGHGGMSHGSGPMSSLHGVHRLNLSPEQDDKIFNLMHKQAPAQRDQMRALRDSESALRTLKTAPDYSDAKARALIDQIAKQRADLEMSQLQHERQVLDVLTPEQRKQLSEMKPPRRGEGRTGARGERRGPPPAPAAKPNATPPAKS